MCQVFNLRPAETHSLTHLILLARSACCSAAVPYGTRGLPVPGNTTFVPEAMLFSETGSFGGVVTCM